eukprot:gene10217-21304_t
MDLKKKSEIHRSGSCGTFPIAPSHSKGPVCAIWTISDALDVISEDPKPNLSLPLVAFNHIAREVLCIHKSKRFYCEVLGFRQTARPPFECEGYWLVGHGLNLHLVQTSVPEYRRALKKERILHFSSSLPRVDHIGFICEDLELVERSLDQMHVYYKKDEPVKGIRQIFLFDPDGNVIEVSSCAPPPGYLRYPRSVHNDLLKMKAIDEIYRDLFYKLARLYYTYDVQGNIKATRASRTTLCTQYLALVSFIPSNNHFQCIGLTWETLYLCCDHFIFEPVVSRVNLGRMSAIRSFIIPLECSRGYRDSRSPEVKIKLKPQLSTPSSVAFCLSHEIVEKLAIVPVSFSMRYRLLAQPSPAQPSPSMARNKHNRSPRTNLNSDLTNTNTL